MERCCKPEPRPTVLQYCLKGRAFLIPRVDLLQPLRLKSYPTTAATDARNQQPCSSQRLSLSQSASRRTSLPTAAALIWSILLGCTILREPPPTIVCDDLSDPTPCCGVGECNIFCCNCDGGMCVVRLVLGKVFVGLALFLWLRWRWGCIQWSVGIDV